MTSIDGPGDGGFKCEHNLAGTEVHIRPRGDHIWHTLDDECPCGPTGHFAPIGAPAAWIYIHHALDGRKAPPGNYAPTPGPCDGHNSDDDDGYDTCAA